MSEDTTNPERSEEENILLDHAYDGIQEYDNPLPGWWKWMFVASIAFSPLYWMFYHGGAEGRSIQDVYSVEMANSIMDQFAGMGELTPDSATLVKYMSDEGGLRAGQAVFKTNCIQCHGRRGEGKVGPNLTDEAFKNVKQIEDIARVINQGASGGAMPAWKNRLHPNEVVLVAAYVASLRGQNISPGKPAEDAKLLPGPSLFLINPNPLIQP